MGKTKNGPSYYRLVRMAWVWFNLLPTRLSFLKLAQVMWDTLYMHKAKAVLMDCGALRAPIFKHKDVFTCRLCWYEATAAGEQCARTWRWLRPLESHPIIVMVKAFKSMSVLEFYLPFTYCCWQKWCLLVSQMPVNVAQCQATFHNLQHKTVESCFLVCIHEIYSKAS